MSTPVNPLDRFRSYSYHHILMVSTNTESIRAIVNPETMPQGEQDVLSKLSLGNPISIGNGNSTAYLLCDTRKVSHFSINEVSYDSYIRVGENTFSNAVISPIKISIIDSHGVAFINYLDYIQNKMKVSIHKATYLLKTIFVGHTDTGSTEIIKQEAIPMLLTKMNMSPDHRGSVVAMEFTAMSQGAVLMNDDYNRMFDISGIFSPTNRLKDAVKSLENTLNSKSRDWFKKIQIKRVEAFEGLSGEKISPDSRFGKLVQYMFTVPDDWDSFEVHGIYERSTESKFAKGGYKDPITTKGVYIGFNASNSASIKDALEVILRQSQHVQKLASNQNRQDGKTQSYEILTTVTSDDDTITIHFDVVNYAIPKTQRETAQPELQSGFKPSDKNLMTFDYIFSGKNSDIIDFAMQMNNVQIFLADNLYIGDKIAEETAKDQKDKVQDKTSTKKKESIINIQENDPILPPIKSASQQMNMPWITETDGKRDYVTARQQFIHNMSVCHGMSSTDVALKIRGNPNLFSRFTADTIFPHVKIIDSVDLNYVQNNESFIKGTNGEFLNKTDRKQYVDEKDAHVKKMGEMLATSQKNIPTLVPFYVRVNIKGQLVDVNQLDNVTPHNTPYTNLFYTGYYIVKKITHTFSGGEFRQDLLLGAVPDDLYGKDY